MSGWSKSRAANLRAMSFISVLGSRMGRYAQQGVPVRGAPVSAGEIPELPYEVFKAHIGFLFHDSLSRQQLQFFPKALRIWPSLITSSAVMAPFSPRGRSSPG